MPRIERLRADHAPALLAFERANRAYFARWVTDRGDDYFERFDERHRALLTEQAEGTIIFHVVVGDDGSVLGRVNLVDVADGAAELGFRVAEHAAGQGLATAAVGQVCAMARAEYDLSTLRAAAAVRNVGSRTVLTRTGFVPVGETELAGAPAITYVRDLVRAPAPTARPWVRTRSRRTNGAGRAVSGS